MHLFYSDANMFTSYKAFTVLTFGPPLVKHKNGVVEVHSAFTSQTLVQITYKLIRVSYVLLAVAASSYSKQ